MMLTYTYPSRYRCAAHDTLPTRIRSPVGGIQRLWRRDSSFRDDAVESTAQVRPLTAECQLASASIHPSSKRRATTERLRSEGTETTDIRNGTGPTDLPNQQKPTLRALPETPLTIIRYCCHQGGHGCDRGRQNQFWARNDLRAVPCDSHEPAKFRSFAGGMKLQTSVTWVDRASDWNSNDSIPEAELAGDTRIAFCCGWLEQQRQETPRIA